MKNLNNLVYLIKSANQKPSEQPVKKDDSIFKESLPEPKNYSEALNHPQGGYTQGEFLENASPTHSVDTEPVPQIDNKRQITFSKEPNLTLDMRLRDAMFKPTTDLTQPITLAEDPQDYFKKYVTQPTTPTVQEEKQAWHDKLVNWIKENPWTAGAGALGLGGLGYYLLSDDDDEEEEEE